MIRPRTLVENLPPYGAPEEGRRGLVRMDFNENTMCFPEGCPANVEPDWLSAYPEYQEFVEALARHWQVSPQSLILTNGSDEGLSIIPMTFIEPGQDTAVISRPTFSMIPHYLKLAGAKLYEVPVTPELAFDIAAIEAALSQGPKLAIFASPDNPTGAVIDPNQVADWCRRFPNTLFTLDEAYAEYADQTVVPLLQSFSNLLVTRTFSKAWGLAGVRLGVVLGHPELISALYRVRSPYSVNASAVWSASRLLPKASEVLSQAKTAMARKAELMAAVQERGYSLYPGQANFFLLAAGLDAQRLQDFCRSRGVLIRNRSSALTPNGDSLWGLVRVSVGTEAENQQFLDCLDAFRDENALIFDLDDTLVDTSRSFDVTVQTLVERHSDNPFDLADLQRLRAEGGFNDDWDSTVELLKRRGVEISREQIAQEGTEVYFYLAPEAETLMLELELLQHLRKRHRLFIVTGRYRAEYEPLWAKTLDPHYEWVCCRDDITDARPKPAPDHLLALKQTYGLTGGYYVGNSVDDMASAQGAGLIPLGVATTQSAETLSQAGAAYVLSSVQHLGEVFQ